MRFGAAGAALAVLLALAAGAPAAAQEDDESPFRFLKPWIERQLFGSETPPGTSAPPGAESPAATPGTESPATAEGPAAPGEAPAEVPPSLEAGTDPAGEAVASPDAPDALRGSVPPAETSPDAAAASTDQPAEASEPPAVAEPQRPEPLRFAVLAGRSVVATMAAVGPIANDLSASLGRPVEILPLASYGAMVDAQVQRRIDGGFFSAAAYAVADSRCICLEPLVAPRASDGTLAYHAVIVARAGSGIASAADLAGKTVAIGAPDSLGTRRLQLAGLLADGVDPATFGSVVEAESAEDAVSLVAAGVVDAAFAWSSLAGAAESGYSRGTLTGLAAAGRITMSNLTIIWRSPAVEHGPFAVLRTLPEEEKRKIEDYLSLLSETLPGAYDLLDPLYGGGYATVDPQDYSGFGTLLAQDIDLVRLPAGPATTGATSPPESTLPNEPQQSN